MDLGQPNELLLSVGFFNNEHVKLAQKTLFGSLSETEHDRLDAFKRAVIFKNQTTTTSEGVLYNAESWKHRNHEVSNYDRFEGCENPYDLMDFIPRQSVFLGERINQYHH